MGRLNQRMLLWRLQRLGKASRAGLAKSLGMSQPTAGKIVDELLRLGIVEETDDAGDSGKGLVERGFEPMVRLGRPGRMLRLNRTEPRFLAIQLGVSETSVTSLPVGADQEDNWALQVKTPGSPRKWIQELRRIAESFLSRDYWGVLVSVPGIVDEQAGRVLFSPNLHWTEKVELPRLIRQVWDVPVILVQEERALALGHQYLEPECEDFLLVDFGEGVGGALIVGGEVYASPMPINGELGHTPVAGNKRQCGCGAVGCLETLVSTRGLFQSFSEARENTVTSWAAFQAAINGHRVEPWLANTLEAAAVVIAGALNVLGLRHVIITGSLTDLPASVLDYLAQAIVRGALWARFGSVKVEAAPRRRTAGLVAVGIDRLVLPMI
jgi:predicted NBD/HSP70 family sugar kinase